MTDTLLDSIEYKGYTVEIHADYDAFDPSEHGEYALVKMALFHGRYLLANATDYRSEDFEGWAEMRAQMVKDGARVILPIYMIDHSGIALRVGSDFGDIDPGHWDSGQVGFAFATADGIRESYVVKRITKDIEAKAEEAIRATVGEYSSYLEGDAVGYVVKAPDGETVGSCWGFLGAYDAFHGPNPWALDEAKGEIDWDIENDFPKREAERAARLRDTLAAV